MRLRTRLLYGLATAIALAVAIAALPVPADATDEPTESAYIAALEGTAQEQITGNVKQCLPVEFTWTIHYPNGQTVHTTYADATIDDGSSGGPVSTWKVSSTDTTYQTMTSAYVNATETNTDENRGGSVSGFKVTSTFEPGDEAAISSTYNGMGADGVT